MRPAAIHLCHKGLLLLLTGLFASGCATGRLSPSADIGPDQMGHPLASSEAFQPSASEKCFQYGGRGPGASLRPGDRLRIDLLSAGTQDYNYKNTFPPLVRSIDVPIRMAAGGLEIAEQQALTSILQVNRSPAWKQDTSSEGDGLGRSDRQKLAKELRKDEAALWNAFIGSSCVKAVVPGKDDSPDTTPEPVIVVQFDIRALCRALPEGSDQQGDSPRQRFARAFLVSSNTDPEYLNGCGATPTTREPMSALGLRGDLALGDWASTALAANADAGDDYFAQELALASPKAVQGFVSFGSVAPFRPNPPDWSLQQWEQSAICTDPQGTRLVIKAIRLRGGEKKFRITAGEPTTHTLEVVNGERRLLPQQKHFLGAWSLPVAALSDLTAADVDEVVWVLERGSHSQKVKPPGCSSRWGN